MAVNALKTWYALETWTAGAEFEARRSLYVGSAFQPTPRPVPSLVAETRADLVFLHI